MRPPENNAVEVGRTLSLSCLSTGIPDPNVTFFHNSIEVKLDIRIIQQGHFLVITNAGESDSGEYSCIAENVAGVEQSDPARLVIFSKLNSVAKYSVRGCLDTYNRDTCIVCNFWVYNSYLSSFFKYQLKLDGWYYYTMLLCYFKQALAKWSPPLYLLTTLVMMEHVTIWISE